jgi:hypothetical protein
MNKAVRCVADVSLQSGFIRSREGSARRGAGASVGIEAAAAAWNIALPGSPGKIEDQLSHAIRIVV